MYRAHDPDLDREVALKVLRPAPGGAPSDRNRQLIDEAVFRSGIAGHGRGWFDQQRRAWETAVSARLPAGQRSYLWMFGEAAVVLARWGAAKPASHTAAHARERVRALRCSTEPIAEPAVSR